MMDSDKYYFFGDPGGLFSAPMDIEGGSVHDRVALTESDAGVIYEIYDDLCTRYPAFMQKKTLGQVSGYDFNVYRFANYPMENRSDFVQRRFKLLLTTSIHGYEQGCAWTAAGFFRLLCEDRNDPLIAFLRRSVEFVIVPVANPWGFSRNDRRNENRIDINRNFDADFVAHDNPESGYFGGKQPGTELETRFLMQFLEENRDAEYVLDYHNIAKGYPLYYIQSDEHTRIAYAVFSALTDQWTHEYCQFPQDRILGYVKKSAASGMYSNYARKLGFPVFTLETPWCMPEIGREQYDAPTIRTALDTLVNTILAIVRSYR